MNAGPFGRRISLIFAALLLTPLLASAAPVSMDFKTLIDSDNNEATGCTVVTTAGLVKGVDHVLTTSVSYDSAAGTASVTGVTRQTCTDSVANTFSSAIPVDTTGWPVGVGAGGNLFIETHMPRAALGGMTHMHLAVTAASGNLADSVLLDPEGETIVWPPMPGPRRRAANPAGPRTIVLDGANGDWDGVVDLADGSSNASPRLRFLSVRVYMAPNDIFFALSVQSNANAPTANDDSYSVERGKSIGVAVPGVLSNDTDPNGKPLTAVLISGSGTHHGALTLNADGSFNYQNDGSAAPSDSFEYKANNGSADSNAAQVNITITEPNAGPPPVKPAFTSPNTTTFCVGHSNTFTITTTPVNPAVTVAKVSGALPSGVSFSSVPGSGTGKIAGNPASGTGGTYNLVLRATNAVGFTDQNFKLVVSEPATPAPTNGGPYCAGATIALSTAAVSGASYSWTGPNGFTSSLQNPTRPNATNADAGTYSVIVTVGGCTSAPGTTNVVVNATPATPPASNDGPHCPGETISLSTPFVLGATYSWTGPNGFTSTLQNPTRANATTADAGTYSVTITVSGCPSTPGSTNVIVNPTPATPSASNTGPYCVGATIALSTPFVSGATYAWTGPNGFTSTLENPTRANATLADAGTYSVTITVNGCPSAAGSTNVVVNPIPATPTASNTGPYCEGATIALSTPLVASASYAWTGPNGFTSTLQNPTRANATLADAGTYSVTITVNSCPSAPGTTNVVVNATPATPMANNGGPYCEGATISLSTPFVSGATYAWTGPNGFTSTLQNPTRANATLADAGTYSVTITVNGCPSAPGSTNVVVNPIPATPTASNTGPYCVGSTISLSTPTVSGATYSWTGPNSFTSTQQNPTIPNATLADGGTYSVTVTVNGCTSAAGMTNVVVNANPATPTITPSGPTTFCTGGSVTLTAPGGFTYSWSTGATTQSIIVSASGPYSVTVTDGNGCSATSAPTVVIVNPNPPTPIITPSGPTTFCAGGSVTLTAPNGFTYLWSTSETTQSIVVSSSGSYTVTVTDGNGCSATSAATVVTVNPNPPTPTITPGGPTTFCAGGIVTLTAPGGFTYLWSTNETTQSIVVSTSGSYTVTVTDGNGCSSTSAATVVTVNPNPATPTITPSGPTTFCAGGSVTLTAPAGFTYLWSPTNETTQSIVVSTAGSYTVTVTDGNGCSATSAATVVTVNSNPATPTITPSGPTTFCAGGSVTLTAPAGFTYLWSPANETTQSIVVSSSGSYTVTVTDGNGCSSTSAATVVTVNPNPATPTITPSGPTTFCAGGSVTLTAPGGFTYLWSTGATTQSILVTTTGSFSVTVTDGNGCSATSAPTAVTVNPNPATPTITPSGPTTFCAGGSVTLDAPAGFTYLWSTTETTQSIVVTTSGSYTVTVTDGNGCSSTSAATVVTVNPNPSTPTITPSGPTTFCAGGSVTLNAPGGFTYLWSTNETTQSIVVTTSGSYTVTVTDGNGCSATSAATVVTVNPNPSTPTITPSGPTTFCAGGSVTLNAPGGFTYLWSTGATTQSINVTSSGSFTVTVTDGNGCSATSAATVVTVNANPATPTITPSGPTTFCAGGSVTLTAPGGFTYLWSTGATTQSILVTTTGSFSVTVTDGNGCSATSAPTAVTVNPNPSAPTITPSPSPICADSTGNQASGPGGFTYLWSIVNGVITAGQTAQTVTYTAGSTGTTDLTLTVTDGNGCSASNTVNVSINPSPSAPTITPSASGVCAGSTGNTADGPAGATTYSWGITNGTITSATNIQTITWTAGVAGTTTLTLTVTNGFGCPATNSANVVVNANPSTPTITPSSDPVCPNSTGNTASGPAASTWFWSITGGTITSATNIQTITFTAGASGSVCLTLVVTNAAGCSASNTLCIPIASNITPARNGGGTFPAGTIGTAYNGQSFTASGGTGPYTFAVTGGTFPTNLTLASNGTISGTPTATGTFSFTVTATDTASNCTGSAVFSIAINPSAQPETYSNLVDNTQAYVQGGTTAAPATPAVVLTGTIIANDLPSGGVAAVAGTVTSSAAPAASNNVTIAADGTFLYTPPARPGQPALTSDSFTYTITSNTGGTATPTQATGTVTLNLSGRVWYVNNSLGVNGNGQSQSPFNTAASFVSTPRVTPDVTGDIIFIYNGTGNSTNQNAGIKLLNNEQLIGEGVALVVNSQTLVAAGTKPQITNTTGDILTLANGNTVKGLNVLNPTTGNCITGTNTAGLTMDTMTIQGASAAASGLVLTTPSGTVTITNTAISNSPFGLTINGGTAAFTMNNTNTISSNAGQRTINFSNLGATSVTTIGAGITDNGTGISVTTSVTGAQVSFTGTQTLGTTTNPAVTLTTNNGGIISFSGTLAITTSTGTGFSATGSGTINVSGTANITTGAAVAGLNLNAITVGGSGITFNSVTTTGAATGISVVNLAAAGTVTVNGGTITNGAGTTGVSFQGANTSLSLAGVTITGGSGATVGINSTSNFANLTIGANVSVSAATALNLGPGAMSGSFLHVNSTGGTNGVNLNTVTGSGTWGCTCSGDTLTGASGATFKVTGGGGGTLSWGGVINQANGADAVNISGSNSGTINFSGNVTTSGTSTGINISGSSGTYNFTGGASTITGTGGGITIGSGESGTISFGTGYSINGPTTAAFTINGSPSLVSAAVTYSGTITHNVTGNIFNVTGLSGSLNCNNATATAIQGTFNGNGAVTSAFSNVTGTVTINNMTESSGFNTATGTAVAITGTNTGSTFTFNHLVIAATGTTDTMKGLTMAGGGTLAITATGGNSSISVGSSALDLNGMTLNTSALQTVTSAGRGTTAGIILTNVTGGGTMTISGGTLTGLANTGTFVVSGGSPSVTYSGSITQNAANRAVDLQGGSGAISINSVTCGAAATGIHIGDTSTNNGNVTFTTLTLGTSGARMTNQAVTITNGGSGTIDSLGTISIFTNNAKGLVATNLDGTLNVAGGTVDSSGATAIDIDGPAGLTTLSIPLTSVTSAGGTADGISIQDTNGSFSIVGDGANTTVGGNSSGGTISGKSGANSNVTQGIGVYLNNVTNITLRRITINGTNQNHAIRGNSVAGFTLEYSTVGGTNGTTAGAIANDGEGEGSVIFGDLAVNGITGTATFTNDNISGGRNRNVSITNGGAAATLTLTVKGCTFGAVQNFSDAGTSFAVEARTSGTTINTTFGGPGAGEPNTLNNAVADLANFTGQNGTIMDVQFKNNTLSNNNVNNIIGGGNLNLSSRGSMTFVVNANTMRDAHGSAVTLFKANTGTLLSGQFTNNTIGVSGTAGSGSKSGNGIFVSAAGGGTMAFTIKNNQIHQIAGNSHIYADNTGGSYTANFTIEGNTLDTWQGTNFAGIAITNGSPSSGDTINVCAKIGGSTAAEKNTLNLTGNLGVIVGSSGAAAGHTFNLPTYAGGANLTNVQNFIQGNNSGSFTTSAYADAPATAAAFTGSGTSCPTP